MQAYLWFPEFPKVEWEVEPLAIKLLSCGTSSQFRFGKQTPSLLLSLGLKPSSLIKHIVSYSYAAIGLDCWGSHPPMHWAPFLLLTISPLLSPRNCHHCMSLTLCVLSRSCLCPPLSPSLCPFLQVSPGFEAVCLPACSYWSYQSAWCFVVAFCCSVLFSLPFPLTPTGRGRWPSTLSLVLLEVSSVKGSFSSPLLPMACSRGNCWVLFIYLYNLDFIL